MGTSPKLPYIEDLVSWLGIAWIIAFLAGLWGAMLGIGKFGPSEFMFLLCGAIILGKVAVETMRDRTLRRFVVLALVLLGIALLEFYVMRWTNGISVEAGQQKERLKKLDDIPGLQSQLQALKQQQIIDAATSKQQVSDIGHDNKDLKGSIEKKDAILAAIAKEQLDLNYVPEITITASDTKDTIFVMNNGKTNVVLNGFEIDTMSVGGDKLPQTIAPTTSTRFRAEEQNEKSILAQAQQGNLAVVSHDGTAYLRTQNKKNYSLGFSINYAIKDGAIEKVFIVDHSIVEITKPQ